MEGNKEQVNELVIRLSGELAAQGAAAVILLGSNARGDADSRSDIDIYALGEGPGYTLRIIDNRLVSISWHKMEDEYLAFHAPERAVYTVPAWRDAVILYDPSGIADQIKRHALEWTWEEIDPKRIDRYVADEITGLAEEVVKLVVSMDKHNWTNAAAQRSVLALRIPIILAVQKKILYRSENEVWDKISNIMGHKFSQAMKQALLCDGVVLTESCQAALDMYYIAAQEVYKTLSPRQKEVVDYACTIAKCSKTN